MAVITSFTVFKVVTYSFLHSEIHVFPGVVSLSVPINMYIVSLLDVWRQNVPGIKVKYRGHNIP